MLTICFEISIEEKERSRTNEKEKGIEEEDEIDLWMFEREREHNEDRKKSREDRRGEPTLICARLRSGSMNALYMGWTVSVICWIAS